MFSFIKSEQTFSGNLVHAFCLSTDTPPTTGIANGSVLEELNASTGAVKKYFFDAASATWIEVVEAGSGGGK